MWKTCAYRILPMCYGVNISMLWFRANLVQVRQSWVSRNCPVSSPLELLKVRTRPLQNTCLVSLMRGHAKWYVLLKKWFVSCAKFHQVFSVHSVLQVTEPVVETWDKAGVTLSHIVIVVPLQLQAMYNNITLSFTVLNFWTYWISELGRFSITINTFVITRANFISDLDIQYLSNL